MSDRIPATSQPKISGIPAAPLRLLLMGHPDEFDQERAVGASESDRDFMLRQARRLIEFDDGAGVQFLSAAEYTRIKRVWLELEQGVPAVEEFSKGASAEMLRTEDRIFARLQER